MDPEVGYIHNGSVSSDQEKKKSMQFEAIWMELEGIMLSKTSHRQNDKNRMISLIGRETNQGLNTTDDEPCFIISL